MEKDCLKNHILNIQCKYVKLTEKWIDFVKLGKPCPDLECSLILADWGLDILCKVYDSYQGNNTTVTPSTFDGLFANELFLNGIPNSPLSPGDGSCSIADNNGVWVGMTVDSPTNFYEIMNQLLLQYSTLTGYTIECYENDLAGNYLGEISPSTWDPVIPTYYKIIMPCDSTTRYIGFYGGYYPVTLVLILNLGGYGFGPLPDTFQEGVCAISYSLTYKCMSEEQICTLIEKLYKLLDTSNCC